MCGRYNIVTDAGALIDAFDIVINELSDSQLNTARYNIPPTSTVPLVFMRDGQRTLTGAHWGLLPHWAKDKKLAFKTFNARAETITEKASFRSPIQKSRCIVPASGWYEWRKEGDIRQPYYFHTDGLIPFAGISAWHPEFEMLSCSIITTAANPVAAAVHHRMPVILQAERVDQWMAESTDLDNVLSQLNPYAGGDLSITRVSTRVNNTRYHDPDFIEAV